MIQKNKIVNMDEQDRQDKNYSCFNSVLWIRLAMLNF